MTEKTVSWVAPELNGWANPKKGGEITYFVNVYFADDDSGSVGKESQDKALELQGLLTELIGEVAEFTLESKNKTNNKGGQEWRIKGFPGYEPAPYVPGGGGGTSSGHAASWYNSETGVRFTQERTDRRTALMQAVAIVPAAGMPERDNVLIAMAELMYTWLRETSAADTPSVPAEPAGDDGGTLPSPATTSSPAAGPASAGVATKGAETSAGDENVGGTDDGEASCPPHDLADIAPNKLGRRPCQRCGAWVK